MTPLERAARALHKSQDGLPAEKPADWSDTMWREEQEIALQIAEEAWREYVDDVRAVLTAIREPSEGMEGAIAKAIEDTLPCDSGTDPPDAAGMVELGVSKAVAAAMIDAALAEGE